MTSGLPTAPRRHTKQWQAALWRRIAEALDVTRRHPSLEFFNAIEAGKTPPATHATRVHVFCVPSMPPLYLDIVRGLARFRDVDLYALNPCREYWFDIVDAKRLSWLAARGTCSPSRVGQSPAGGMGRTDEGVPVARCSTTRAKRSSTSRTSSRAPATTLLAATAERDSRSRPTCAPASVVARRRRPQRRTPRLPFAHARARGAARPPARAVRGRSARCTPADVLVVTPDLATTAPLIDAVFGNAPPPRRIPYAITGRPRSEENPVARRAARCARRSRRRALRRARCSTLLQRPIVARRFGLDADALASVHRWIQVSGIRWGLDASTRAALDLPADGALHVRRRARPAVRSATRGRRTRRRPSTAACRRGDRRRLRSAGARRVRALRRRARRGCARLAARRQTPAQWFDALHDVLATSSLPAPDDAEAIREVHVALATLRDDMAARRRRREPLPLSVVQAALAAHDRRARPAAACRLVPSRSRRWRACAALPYRVVCAIGLDDGAFPGAHARNEFDLMRPRRARGDRQRRLDDRNVLLDLLLAARDVFHVSLRRPQRARQRAAAAGRARLRTRRLRRPGDRRRGRRSTFTR